MSAGEMFENLVVISPVKVVWQRNRIILPRSGRFVQYHDPVRIRIRQRSKQNCVDDAKDGGVGADAERERDDRNGGEGGILDQLSKRKTKMIHNIFITPFVMPQS